MRLYAPMHSALSLNIFLFAKHILAHSKFMHDGGSHSSVFHTLTAGSCRHERLSESFHCSIFGMKKENNSNKNECVFSACAKEGKLCRRFGDLIKKMRRKKRIVKIWCKTSYVKVPHCLVNIFLHCSYYYIKRNSLQCNEWFFRVRQRMKR